MDFGPIQDFSSGYYGIELRATPYSGGPVIDGELFRYIEGHLYANTDAPVWMKPDFNGSSYFKLTRGEAMPRDLIGLPDEWMQDFDLDDDNESRLFYICKPGHAHFISQSAYWGDTYEREDDT